MKKSILNPGLFCIALLVIVSSCKKNDTSKEKAPYNIANNEVPEIEGYTPSYTGKTINAVYNGRDAELLEIEDGKYLYDGDIVLERKDIIIEGEPNTEGAGISLRNKTWFAKRVNYVFAANLSVNFQNQIKWALGNLTNEVWFSFNYRGSGDYIEFQKNNIGSAYSTSVGRGGGKQIISIDPNHFGIGAIMHEVCHAIGLYHEQSRPDRDTYINVNVNNIVSQWKGQYAKCSYCKTTGFFDFNSIMLYPSYAARAAVKANVPIMTKKNGSTWDVQRSFLSTGDRAAVKALYE